MILVDNSCHGGNWAVYYCFDCRTGAHTTQCTFTQRDGELVVSLDGWTWDRGSLSGGIWRDRSFAVRGTDTRKQSVRLRGTVTSGGFFGSYATHATAACENCFCDAEYAVVGKRK